MEGGWGAAACGKDRGAAGLSQGGAPGHHSTSAGREEVKEDLSLPRWGVAGGRALELALQREKRMQQALAWRSGI